MKPGATTADPVTVVASVVHVERALPAAVQTIAAAGEVSAVNGHLVTVALHEATFLPGANAVVVDISAAKFAHGSAAELAGGVDVAFRGTLSGAGAATVVVASDVDVQGAPSAREVQQHPEQKFSAINGQVAAVHADGSFTVQQAKADGPIVVPGTYTIAPQNATYLAGNASCITVGAVVQAVGSLLDATLTARFVNVKNCAGEPHAEPAPAPRPTPAPASGASGPK